MEQRIEKCIGTFQVMGSNLTHLWLCGICFLLTEAPQLYVPGVTSAGDSQPYLDLIFCNMSLLSDFLSVYLWGAGQLKSLTVLVRCKINI